MENMSKDDNKKTDAKEYETEFTCVLIGWRRQSSEGPTTHFGFENVNDRRSGDPELCKLSLKLEYLNKERIQVTPHSIKIMILCQ